MRNTVRKIIEKEIEEYEGNYLSSFLFGYIKSMGLNGRLTKIEIFEIVEEYLITSNNYLENNQISSSATSDPADKEKIKELEKEIKELKETIAKKNKDLLDQNKLKAENKKLIEELKNERINIEKTDIAYLKKHEKLMKLENTHNARGAGRKPKITQEQIAMIQMLRAQGKTLQEIQAETGISYGNIQKYCKLITDNKKRAGL